MPDDYGVRLYHPRVLPRLFLLGFFLALAGCSSPEISQGRAITVTIQADEEEFTVQAPAGSTVENALEAVGIALEPLDRTEPPMYTVLDDGSRVSLIRVEEEFVIEQVVLPYERQVVRNESLPEGEEYWLQLGQNGLQENTIRRLYENGEEISSSVVKSVIVKEALPQIQMIGVQKPFAPLPIPGRLAYILDGDAWVMEGTTGNRRQIVTTGDLDGRVFSLSPDGEWLLFTRRGEAEDTINTLWTASLTGEEAQLVDLEIANVIHFADWQPGANHTIGYSTVEPRPAAPGWQANNDLGLVTFSSTGWVRHLQPILEANSGGIYGWWGTSFAWSPDGLQLAFARPDGLGLLDLASGSQSMLVEITPLQTFGDWAWVPGMAWSPKGDVLYSVAHIPPAESQQFDLIVASPAGELTLTPQVGMFAYPAPSPLQPMPSGEASFRLAYLQAIFPVQSESSRYRLAVMDNDGSNRRTLFPAEGAGGLEPQRVVWSPGALEDRRSHALAVVYQNNLWLVDSESGEAWQVTGDGLTSRLDWR